MRLCFINEINVDEDHSRSNNSPPKSVDDYFNKQESIRNEARKALAQVILLGFMKNFGRSNDKFYRLDQWLECNYKLKNNKKGILFPSW